MGPGAGPEARLAKSLFTVKMCECAVQGVLTRAQNNSTCSLPVQMEHSNEIRRVMLSDRIA